MKLIRPLKIFAAFGALVLSLATAHGQSISWTTTTDMNVEGADGANGPFRISVKAGNAKWVKSVAAGGTSGVLGDGTLLDWQIHTAVNNESPFQGSTVSAGPGTYFSIATCADASVGGPQNYFDVWELNDVDTEASDIPNGTTPAVGNLPTPIGGNIDISGLTDGQIYVLHGSYRSGPRVELTMTGPGKTPISLTRSEGNPGSFNRMRLMEFAFTNPGGEYTNIEWFSSNNQDNTARRRWGGIFLDGTIFVDTVAPTWEAGYPNADPVGSTVFTLNTNVNEACTVYYVVLPDGATPPTSAQVAAGTDAADAPVALSGNFASDALVATSELVTGLTASTAYDVYVVAEDVRGPNLQAAPELLEFTTNAPDFTPPNWTATYPQQSRNPASVIGTANIDEAGYAYFVVLSSGASVPTSAQVKAGTDASDTPAPSGTITGLTAGVDGSDVASGLTIGTTYDLYFVAEDLQGNLQGSPQLVVSAPAAAVEQFTSGGSTWGTDSVWSSVTGGPYTNAWGAGNNAVFEGGSGTVTVDSGTTVGDITFNSNNWLFNGGPLNLASTTTPTITVNGNLADFECALSGTQGLIKEGSGLMRFNNGLTTNTITGGWALNGGNLGDNSGPLGANELNGNDITTNGGSDVGITFKSGETHSSAFTLNAPFTRMSCNNSTTTINGAVTGTGGIEMNKTGDGTNNLYLYSTSNSFTGGVNMTSSRQCELRVRSFVDSDSPGAGNISFAGARIDREYRFYLDGAFNAPLTFNNRQFDIADNGEDDSNEAVEIRNDSAQPFTINTDLIVSGTSAKRLQLQGTGAGINTFAGDMPDGPNPGAGDVLSVEKYDSGTWILSGDNTYTGATTVSAGTLGLVGGSHTSAITVNSGATLGFTLGSPTTSTAAVTLDAGHKIAVTGTPDGTSDYLLMTAASFSGTPVLDPAVGGYTLEIQGAGTQLVLTAPAPTTTIVIDLGAGTAIEGGAFGTFGATNLPLPALPVGSILRSVSVDVTITATDNDNWANELAILFDPTPGTPGGDFSLSMTSGTFSFGAANQLNWSGGASGPPTPLVETKNAADWAAVGPIDLASYGIFLGNAYQIAGWVSPQGGTWSGTITLTYDLVTTGAPYDTWSAGPFLGTLTDPTASLDFDRGGLPTGVEWVVGGDPTDDSDDVSLAPTLDLTTSPGNALFTFRRTAAANADPNTTIKVEYGSTLLGWSDAVDGVDGVVITVVPDGFGPGIDKVTVSLPNALAVDGNLFARLNVAIAP